MQCFLEKATIMKVMIKSYKNAVFRSDILSKESRSSKKMFCKSKVAVKKIVHFSQILYETEIDIEYLPQKVRELKKNTMVHDVDGAVKGTLMQI